MQKEATILNVRFLDASLLNVGAISMQGRILSLLLVPLRAAPFRSFQTSHKLFNMANTNTDMKIHKAHDALAEVSVTGKFIRTASGFREIISADHPVYKPEFHRYHLYISLACPWANRCLAEAEGPGRLYRAHCCAPHMAEDQALRRGGQALRVGILPVR